MLSDFMEHYWEILSDPAHLAVEVTLMLVVDVIFLGLVWPLMSRWVRNHIHRDLEREHLALDAEHGVSHEVALEPERLGPHDVIAPGAFASQVGKIVPLYDDTSDAEPREIIGFAKIVGEDGTVQVLSFRDADFVKFDFALSPEERS